MSNKKNRNKLPARQPSVSQTKAPKSVQERQLRVLRETQLATRITSGPIPSGDEMIRYGEAQANLPDRIMAQHEKRTAMAEAQSVHRMQMESKTLGNNIVMERLGWFSASTIGLVTIGGSLWLLHEGKSLAGLAGILMSLATLLGLYVFSRKDQVQEVAKKRAANMLKDGITPQQLDMLLPPPKDMAVQEN